KAKNRRALLSSP
ncbi:hypothetical protein CP082626L3_0728B, partial [Chlamydia psittaci 08-2626_L3]